MNIKEEKNPNEIHIQKFKFSCDDIDPTIPRPLPQSLNFFMGLIGIIIASVVNIFIGSSALQFAISVIGVFYHCVFVITNTHL